ncbi:hypothetical protein [Mycobacterium malmoense]|uniref:hypothetical protein n=1 Tax=Mycobacterium malmoense TaxID=1780 RepID=UPI0024467081|nr:hypothetical protein [Mycobacterium malmoense]
MAKPDDLTRIRELIAPAHVFIEDFGPEVFGTPGAGPGRLERAEPKPVAAQPARSLYCYTSGYFMMYRGGACAPDATGGRRPQLFAPGGA